MPSARPLIYLITEGKLTDDNFDSSHKAVLDTIAAAQVADMVQIREKSVSARNLLLLVTATLEITRNSKTRLLVNDRVDIAMAGGADGVHLTETSLPVDVVRTVIGNEMLIGCSAHSTAGTKDAAAKGADFAVLGPVFEPPGKTSLIGLDELESACEQNPGFPILAIGGIDSSNYSDALEAGAAGFAAIRYLNNKANLSGLARELKR